MKKPPIFLSTLLLLLSQPGQLQTRAPSEIQNWDMAAATLAANRALWESHDFHAYSFVSNKSCFGCNRFHPARLSVTADSVITATSPDTGEPIDIGTVDFPGYTHDLDAVYETVEELFSIIETAITNHWGTAHAGAKASNVSVAYDAVYGYPTLISADYSRGLDAAGSESKSTDSLFTYRILEFTPTP